MLFLRGEQISGEYATGSLLDDDGWFCTRDHGWVDAEGYLFIEGRADDTIIRGGENIAPAEIEEVLLAQPAVEEACVVGIPDDEWGQRIEAAVVLRDGASASADDLRDAVRAVLRGSKTPDRIVFRDSLPHTDTGKMLRRVVLQEMLEHHHPSRLATDTPRRHRSRRTTSHQQGAPDVTHHQARHPPLQRRLRDPDDRRQGAGRRRRAHHRRRARARPRPPTASGSVADGHGGGTLIGKRYVDDGDTIELLCTKAGDGLPAIDGQPLSIKDAKPLPASD